MTVACTFLGGSDADGVRYDIDWDDGSTDSAPTTGYYADLKAGAWDHTYTATGTYTIQVRAESDDGRFSGWTPFAVTV